MGVKSLFFGIVVFSLYFTSVVSKEHAINSAVCDLEKLAGKPCTVCNFLTFGQEEAVDGVVSYFCPSPKDVFSDSKNEYCCYDQLRRPFCCNFAAYLFTGFLWVAAVLLVFGAIVKFIKCLIS